MIHMQTEAVRSLERGKQVGASIQLNTEVGLKWISVAFQKLGNEYLMHAHVIVETKMASETYELDETRAFQSLHDAINGGEKLLSAYQIDLRVGALKGQYIFNPQAETILRDT